MNWVDKLLRNNGSQEYRGSFTNARDNDPGEYDLFTLKQFPSLKRDLPIIAPDNSFTMDIMFLSTVISEDDRGAIGSAKRRLTGMPIAEDDDLTYQLDGRYAPKWESALVFVETTSRYAMAFPMHGKFAKEVLIVFKDFLNSINMNISTLTSDSGREYFLIRRFLENFQWGPPGNKQPICKYYQVNSSQNHHTALSRVDRFIRTLRNMIAQYYNAVGPSGNWVKVLHVLVKDYNNSKHSALWLRGRDRDGKIKKFYYTPEQVYTNPELRRRIKLKDYLEKYKNYAKIDSPLYYIGKEVYYRVTSSRMKDRNRRGFLSQYPAKIVGRTGNRFRIQLKSDVDRDEDRRDGDSSHYSGPTVEVPFRDIIPATKTAPKKSRYNITQVFERIHRRAEEEAPSDDDDSDDDDDNGDNSDSDDNDSDDPAVDYVPHRAIGPVRAPSPPPAAAPPPMRRRRRNADDELYSVNHRAIAEPGSRRPIRQINRYSDDDDD